MKKKLPFDFVLDYLFPLAFEIKPMFGCHAVYLGEKIMLILRSRKEHPEDNGVWIATSKEHHAGLTAEFPSMRSINLLGKGPTNWQVLPADTDDFEASVVKVCELIKKGDVKVGVIPKKKKLKKKLLFTPSLRGRSPKQS